MLKAIETLRREVARLIVKTDKQERKLEEHEYRLDQILPHDED